MHHSEIDFYWSITLESTSEGSNQSNDDSSNDNMDNNCNKKKIIIEI